MTARPAPSRFWYACVCGSVCVRQQNASNPAQRIVSLPRCLFCSPLYIVPGNPVCEPHSLLSMERCQSCCVAFPGSVLGGGGLPSLQFPPPFFSFFSFDFCFLFFLQNLKKNLKDCCAFVHNNHDDDKKRNDCALCACQCLLSRKLLFSCPSSGVACGSRRLPRWLPGGDTASPAHRVRVTNCIGACVETRDGQLAV